MAEAPSFPWSRDLGNVSGPVLASGGVLSNFDALQALFTEARRLGVAADRLICTGDVAGYCAEPEECLALLRENDVATVLGNVEEALAAAPGGRCGITPARSACRPTTARRASGIR